MRLSPNELSLLLAMNEHCSTEYEDFGGFTCYTFKGLARMSSLDPKLIRRTVRSLARKGLTGYEKGLMNENGEVCGAGYGITKLGRETADEILSRNG